MNDELYQKLQNSNMTGLLAMIDKRDKPNIYLLTLNRCLGFDIAFILAHYYAEKANQYLADNPSEDFSVKSISRRFAYKAWAKHENSKTVARSGDNKRLKSVCLDFPVDEVMRDRLLCVMCDVLINN